MCPLFKYNIMHHGPQKDLFWRHRGCFCGVYADVDADVLWGFCFLLVTYIQRRMLFLVAAEGNQRY